MRKQYTNPFIESPLEKSMRDYSIWLHLLEDGEPVFNGFTALRALASTAATALKTGSNAATLRSAVEQMDKAVERGTWDKSYLLTMVSAINTIKTEYPRLRPEVARSAVNKVMGVTA
jgi:hypothetical protein